jgi:TolB-like protein
MDYKPYGGSHMKKTAIVFCSIVAFAAWSWAAGPILSMADFTVESDNPEYKYLGKGLAIMVGGELRKSKQVELIEREQLNAILKEMEFSLSDLANEQNQLKVGNMLSAQYLVMGNVVDMGVTLLVSVRVVEVSTGKIAWEDNTNAKLASYDYIGAVLAKSILTHFGATAVASTEQKVETIVEKKPDAILALSAGVDAFDRNDTQTAQKALEQAAKLDPANEAASYYLAKLVTNTTKFKVNTEPFYSYQNPAFLGILRMDRFHFSSGWQLDEIAAPLFFGTEHAYIPVPGYASLTAREQDMGSSLGYYFPMGKAMGFGAEAFWSLVTSEMENQGGTGPNWLGSRRMPIGATLNFGVLVSEGISLGAGFTVYSQKDFGNPTMSSTPYSDIADVAASGNAGFLIRNPDESLVFDTRIGYSTGTTDLIDPATLSAARQLQSTIFNENSMTFALDQKRLFIVLKQLNDVSVDRIFYYGRLLPAMEYFIAKWFSLRGGVEGALVLLNQSANFGYGILGGMTFRVPDWGFDVDLNCTFRMRPSRIIEGMMVPQTIMFLNFNLSNVFLKRQ